MPNWKKVITSGSNAHLNHITASGNISSSGHFIGTHKGVGSGVANKVFFEGDGGPAKLASANQSTTYLNFGQNSLGIVANNEDTFNVNDDGLVRVGTIGESHGTKALQVHGDISCSGNIHLEPANLNQTVFITTGSAGTDTIRFGIGTAKGEIPATALTVSGSISSSGFVSASSFSGDGSGLTNVSATATPAGSDTQVQFNDGGSLGGDSGLVYNKTSDTLTATNIGAFSLTGKLTAGSTEIEGTAFDINGGVIDSTTIGGSTAAAGTFTLLTGTNITASGNISASGTITANSVDINGGTIDGITSLTAGGNLDIGPHNLTVRDLTVDGSDIIIGAENADGFKITQDGAGNLNIHQGDDNNISFLNIDGGDIQLQTEDFNQAVYVDNATSRVGIGATSPTSKLQVVGDLTATHITASGNISASGDLQSSKLTIVKAGASSNEKLISLTGGAGSEKFSVDEDGDLVAQSLTVDDITIDGSTISDTGTMNIDVGGDLTLDAAGKDIAMTDGSGTPEFLFNLEDAPELDVDGDFTIDGSGKIKLDSATSIIETVGNITSSGNISASGFISASSFAGDGSGLSNVTSTVDIDSLSALGGTGLHQTQDHFVFSDNGTEKKITFSNLEDAIFGNVSGDATIAAGGALTIADNGVDTDMIADESVTLAKLAHAAANTVLVRDANSTGDPSFKAVTNTQILIGDGTGFTAASLSGDVTMTNAGAVTIAANAVEGSMLNSNVAGTGLTVAGNNIDVDAAQTQITSVGTLTGLTVDGNITASGDISASGDITAEKIITPEFSLLNPLGTNPTITKGTANAFDFSNHIEVTGNITSTGDVTVGGANLFVGNSGTNQWELMTHSSGLLFRSASTQYMDITDEGNVLIGKDSTTDSGQKLQVAGDISASGAITATDPTITYASASIVSLANGGGYGEIIDLFPAHGGTVAGDVVFYLGSAGIWRTGVNSAAYSVNMAGVALENGDGSTPTRVLIRGVVRLGAGHIEDTSANGEPLYAGDTLGHVQFAVPGSSGEYTRIMGYCLVEDDDIIYFNPDNTYVERS